MLSAALAVKLFAAPALIGLASFAGRRWGPNIAGLMGGLPLVGAPVVLAVWLSHGVGYAETAARAAPAGLWANIVYMLVVGFVSARWRWYAAIPFGWLCYLGAALLIDACGLALSLWFGVASLPALWLAARYLLPLPRALPPRVKLPPTELFARMGAAAVLVFSLATVSELIGPELTGLLSGAPVAAVVIPAFTFATAGRDALLLTLRGFLTGLIGFGVFFLILGRFAASIGSYAFFPALLGGVATGLAATRLAHQLATRPAR
ncbi:MAG TPA: hypothetical protein VGE51_16575 [Fontimonas sp.]